MNKLNETIRCLLKLTLKSRVFFLLLILLHNLKFCFQAVMKKKILINICDKDSVRVNNNRLLFIFN